MIYNVYNTFNITLNQPDINVDYFTNFCIKYDSSVDINYFSETTYSNLKMNNFGIKICHYKYPYWTGLYNLNNSAFWALINGIFNVHSNDVLEEEDYSLFLEFHNLILNEPDFYRLNKIYIDYCNSIANLQNKLRFL